MIINKNTVSSLAFQNILIDALNIQKGGGVTVLNRLAVAFAQKGHRVTVLLAHDVVKNELDKRIIYVIKPELRNTVYSVLYRLIRLNGFIYKHGYDCILTFNYYAPVKLKQITYHINVVPFLPFLKRVKLVGLVRAILQNSFACAALRLSSVNIFESNHVYELAKTTDICIQSPSVVYIGVDEPSKRVDTVPELKSRRSIVTVTSGAWHKRNDLMLSFFRRYLEVDSLAQLVIVGDSESIRASLRSNDREFADSSPKVSFSGYLDRDSLFAQLSQSTALVTFSEFESFYMVALEAMSVGCPIIAPDISSIRESTGQSDWLFPPGDVEEALKLMQRLRDPVVWITASERGKVWAARFNGKECAQTFVERAIASLETL